MNSLALLLSVSLVACGGVAEYATTNEQDLAPMPTEYVVSSPAAHLTKVRDLQWALCEKGDHVLSGSCMYVSSGPTTPLNGTWRPENPDERHGYFCVTEGESYGAVRTFAVCTRDSAKSLEDMKLEDSK